MTDASSKEAGDAQILSADPTRRAIELAFLKRFLDAIGSSVRIAGDAVTPDLDATVESTLQRLRNPAFSDLADALEKEFPTDFDFRRPSESS